MAIDGALNERRDTLNLFYELETRAKSSRSNHVWIIFEGRTYTYAQAYDTVLRYGAWLKSKGVEKEEIVAMDFMNSELFIWVWFGLWSIGAKPAFINYNLTGTPLVHTIKTSTARLVLVDENLKNKYQGDALSQHGFASLGDDKYGFELEAGQVPKSVQNQTTTPQSLDASGQDKLQRQLQIVHFDRELEAQILNFPPTRLPDSAREGQTRAGMAMLIYTSGTTGLPKPAVVSWGKTTGASKFVAGWMKLRGNDVVYTSMPLYHSSASILGLCPALRAGTSICLSKRFSHKTFWPEIHASKATIIHYVGETCRYLLSAPPTPLDKGHHLRAAFGNGLRPDVWEPFKARFSIPTIFEFYAATESPGGLWNCSTNDFSSGAVGRNGSITSLLQSSSTCIVLTNPDDAEEPLRDPKTGLCVVCPPNEPGELLFKLDPEQIKLKFQGYLNNESANNKKILRDVKKKGDAWFRTGDAMRNDSEGRWFFVDRLGDTFRWKAENVSTAEVADCLGRHDAVAEANVYGVQVPGYDGRAGCAAVVLKSDDVNDQTLRSLAQHVTKELPGFAQPIWLRVTKEMAITGTNKLQKTVLQKEGIDPEVVGQKGDELFWLSGGTYKRFGKGDLKQIEGGQVKL